MVPTYSQYIIEYVRMSARRPRLPGEHHFVSSYLAPKLFSINSIIPDYINPDGTKDILGDIVYYTEGSHHFSIEVKLGSVRLTRREFNEGIVDQDPEKWPNIFIGIGASGLVFSPWRQFREAYMTAVGFAAPNPPPAKIPDGYGPVIRVDKLSCHVPNEAYFPVANSDVNAMASEEKFTQALCKSLDDAQLASTK